VGLCCVGLVVELMIDVEDNICSMSSIRLMHWLHGFNTVLTLHVSDTDNCLIIYIVFIQGLCFGL